MSSPLKIPSSTSSSILSHVLHYPSLPTFGLLLSTPTGLTSLPLFHSNFTPCLLESSLTILNLPNITGCYYAHPDTSKKASNSTDYLDQILTLLNSETLIIVNNKRVTEGEKFCMGFEKDKEGRWRKERKVEEESGRRDEGFEGDWEEKIENQ